MTVSPTARRNGEGGTEDAFAMGELAKAWTRGLQVRSHGLQLQ